ncbi:MAG: type II secretion system minor pseudopilin GspI [Gammaproteobacteria bacterium]|nr:type II secretion system minor pseudopilin GspI [Gammaproteobacteria bacterium]
MTRSAGFTLLEVLVALAIVATALYAAVGSARGAARGAAQIDDTVLAHWVAMNALAEARLAPPAQHAESTSHQVTEYGAQFVVTTRPVGGEGVAAALSVQVAKPNAPENIIYRLEVPFTGAPGS